MTNPLRSILDNIAALRSERPVVIFDLDGTLYDNRPRTLRIVHAYAAGLSAEHAADAERILAMRPGDLRYRLEETLSEMGIDRAVIDGAKARWAGRFFTDTACADDVPLRGAVRFVRQCHQRGATVVYLTGRDIPNMLLGTVRTLRDDGFPIGVPRVELILKPDFEENDTAFKTRLLEGFNELGRVVATFENEPGNANLFHRRWPDAHAVLLNTQHAPEAPPLAPGCHVVDDFELG